MKKLVLLFILALTLIIAYQAHLLKKNKIDASPNSAITSIKETFDEQSKGVRQQVSGKFGNVHEIVLDKTKTIVSDINRKLQNSTVEGETGNK